MQGELQFLLGSRLIDRDRSLARPCEQSPPTRHPAHPARVIVNVGFNPDTVAGRCARSQISRVFTTGNSVTGLESSLAEALRGRYALERELGHGAMATVYLAHDLRHDRPVALKVLHSDLASTLGPERFLREI